MKKKLLTLVFTLVLLIGLVAAVGMSASAATAVIDISAATGVSNYADLVVYLDNLRPKIYIKLTSDIEVTDDARDLSLPVDAGGTFVLDLNGYDIIINSDNTTSIFNVSSTDFHVINSASARSEITLNSITDKASVFYINDARSSLHIYDNILINVAADGINYFYNPRERANTYGIRAGAFDTIAIHGADIYNRSAFGGGVLFSANVAGSKFIIDGNTEITSRFVGLNFAGISSVTGYPDIQLEALHLAYDNADPPVDNVSYNEFRNYTAIGGLANTKTKDIIGPSMQAFYGTSEPYSRFFSNDGDLINNLPRGNNLRIYATGCGHKSGYECYLRLFVPGQIRPLHFTVCSYCGRNAAYNTCTFVTKAEATSEAHGHTAGYDCYCGYKTAQTLHYYKDTVTEKATLTSDGVIASKCTLCGDIQSAVSLAKIGSVTLSATKYVHDGNNKTPKVTVKDANGNKLVKNTDYKLTVASKRSGIGKYTVKVTFIGKYEGTKKVYFTILPGKPASVKSASQTTSSVKLSWSAVSGAAGYTVYRYSPSKKAYVKAGTTEGLTYTVKSLYAGTKYTFRVVAYGKTSGGKVYNSESYALLKTATKTKTPELTKVTASSTKGKAYVYHSNVSGETGYTVYYSTSKDSGFKKYANFKADTTRCDITGLTSGKTYYFKVRTYIKTDSGYVYSAWSAVKGIKVK